MIAVCGYLSIDEVQVSGVCHKNIPGGIVYTALGAARAGADVTLIARVGCDYPREWLDWMNREGLDTGRLVRSAHASRRAVLRHAEDGSRDSLNYSRREWREATDALHPPPIETDLNPTVVALSPMPASAAAMQMGRAPVVMDTSEFYAAEEPAAVLRAMQDADILVPSREETRLLFPGQSDDESLRRLHQQTGRTVIQKRGAQGLVLISRRHPQGLYEPALPTQVVDPTGAGDACVGAIAAGLSQGLSEEELLKLAVRMAAQAVSNIGPKGLSRAA